MSFECRYSKLPAAKSLVWVFGGQFPDQVFYFFGEPLFHRYLAFQYVFHYVNVGPQALIKGLFALREHPVNHQTQAVVVYGEADFVAFEHLRGRVDHSASEHGRGPPIEIILLDVCLARTKISQLDMTVFVDHDVLCFEVSVDDAVFMHEIESQNYLSCIESSFFFTLTLMLVQ